MVRSRMNHPVRVQSTPTPLQGRGISRCLIENRIRLYGRTLTKSPLSTRKGIKLHSRKLPKAELLKPTSKKKTRTFPSAGGVAAAATDDGVVQWVVLIGVVSPSAYFFSSCSLGFGLCLSFSRYASSCSFATCCSYENTHIR